MKYLRTITIITLLTLLAAVPGYRGAQYDIEADTWWGAAEDFKWSWQQLVAPFWEPGESLVNVKDRFGRPYCTSEWHYFDRHHNLHFCVSRLLVLIIWYAYVFLGPWLLLWLIFRQSKQHDNE